MNVVVDDGAVVYVNGNELARINMKTGTAVVMNTLATVNVQGTTAPPAKQLTITDAMIMSGTNIIAVEVSIKCA